MLKMLLNLYHRFMLCYFISQSVFMSDVNSLELLFKGELYISIIHLAVINNRRKIGSLLKSLEN